MYAIRSYYVQVLNQLSPIVIVDESHNAQSDLSVEMLKNLNPSFVLDLTATPKDNSNIISYVDAKELVITSYSIHYTKLYEVNLYPFDYDGLVMLGWTNFQLKKIREANVLFYKALLNKPNGSSALEGIRLIEQ